MGVGDRYYRLLEQIDTTCSQLGRDPQSVQLIVVSKYQPLEAMREVYSAGARHFGENRVQEGLVKQEGMPADVHWHLVGTLQRNKIPKVIGRFDLIHSVDSLSLAEKISASSAQQGVDTPVLLQVNVSGEAQKHGLSVEAWRETLPQLMELEHLLIKGCMTMAPLTADKQVIGTTFAGLRRFRDELCEQISTATELSMGMSHDWPIALAEGATLLRIGSAIFRDDSCGSTGV